MGINYYDKKRN